MVFLDTNVLSETLRKVPNEAAIAWLVRHDAEIALPTVTIAEIAFGNQKVKPDQRAARLEQGLEEWRRRFADRQERGMSAPDGMIAAITRVNGGRLATRNLSDF